MFGRLRMPLLGVLLFAGCGGPSDERELDLGSTVSALNACEETVPATRFIDGVPAYAQCSSVESSAIYSNNGVDTSTTKLGSDWVRTQWSGGYQCTELANRYLRFVWDVTWTPNGNAGEWCDTQPPASSGIVQTTTPVHGDLIVLAPGSCGAAQGTGHVAVVDTVMAGGRIGTVEQNQARRGMYMPSCARCFLHVVANDGTTNPMLPGTGDAGAEDPPPEPDEDASIETPRPSSDAGTRTDAATPTEDDEEDIEDDEEDDDPPNDPDTDDEASEHDDEPSYDPYDRAESGGCTLGSSAPSQRGLWLGLLAVALIRRRRRGSRDGSAFDWSDGAAQHEAE